MNGQHVRGYSFEAGALDKNQTFAIPYADADSSGVMRRLKAATAGG